MESVIRTAIEEVLSILGIPKGDFVVEHPNDLSHGDYACNVALVVSKEMGNIINDETEHERNGQKVLTMFLVEVSKRSEHTDIVYHLLFATI